MFGNYLTSAIRTGVPGLIGALLAWLASIHINAPADTDQWLVGLLTFVLLLAYYLLVRALESRWPALGWLLGTPAKPSYDLDLTPVSVTTTPVTTSTPASLTPAASTKTRAKKTTTATKAAVKKTTAKKAAPKTSSTSKK